MQRENSLEKTLMLGKTEDKKGSQRMRWLDSTTDSMDMNLSKLQEICRTEEPDKLQSMVSQRVRLRVILPLLLFSTWDTQNFEISLFTILSSFKSLIKYVLQGQLEALVLVSVLNRRGSLVQHSCLGCSKSVTPPALTQQSFIFQTVLKYLTNALMTGRCIFPSFL